MNPNDPPRRHSTHGPFTPWRPQPVSPRDVTGALRGRTGQIEPTGGGQVSTANDPDPSLSQTEPPPVMKKILLQSFLALLPQVLSAISPKLKGAIRDLLDSAADKAKTTENPFDDLFVAVLRIILVGGDPEEIFARFQGDWVGLFKSIGPELRRLLSSGVLRLQKLTDATPNDYDDFAVTLLKSALGVKENPDA